MFGTTCVESMNAKLKVPRKFDLFKLKLWVKPEYKPDYEPDYEPVPFYECSSSKRFCLMVENDADEIVIETENEIVIEKIPNK